MLCGHLICTLIFNFVLLCVLFVLFRSRSCSLSLSLSLLFDKIFYSCTRTHARAHTHTQAALLMHCAHSHAQAAPRRGAQQSSTRSLWRLTRSYTHTHARTHRRFVAIYFARFSFALPFRHSTIFFSSQRIFLFRFISSFYFSPISFCAAAAAAAQPLPPSCAAFASGSAAMSPTTTTNQRIKTKSASVLQNVGTPPQPTHIALIDSSSSDQLCRLQKYNWERDKSN